MFCRSDRPVIRDTRGLYPTPELLVAMLEGYC